MCDAPQARHSFPPPVRPECEWVGRGGRHEQIEQRLSSGVALLPRGHLVTSGDSFGQHDCGWQDTTGQWAEAQDTPQHSTLNRTAHRPRVIWPRMSTVFTLRNPGLDKKCKGPLGFPGGASGKEPACQCRRQRRLGFDPWVRKISWRGHGSPL